MHRRIPAASLPILLVSLATAQDGPTRASLLSDFTAAGPTLEWRTVLDGVMGGRSSGAFAIEAGRLRFTGTLNTNGGGFASLRARKPDVDLAKQAGLRIRVRGDGRTYQFRLRQGTGAGRRSRGVSYRAEFATREDGGWTEHWLPFDRFVPTFRGRILDRGPIDPAGIDEIGLMIADGQDGPYRLEVDRIVADQAFDFERFRRGHRPLVVAAPRADDELTHAQLAALRRDRAPFDERDMVLVLLLDEGTSMAGDRALGPEEVRSLRSRFDLAPRSFGLRLVGKDGGVKRRESAPCPMRRIYEQIDAMPMRRAEMRAARGRD